MFRSTACITNSSESVLLPPEGDSLPIRHYFVQGPLLLTWSGPDIANDTDPTPPKPILYQSKNALLIENNYFNITCFHDTITQRNATHRPAHEADVGRPCPRAHCHLYARGSMHLIRSHQRVVHAALVVGYVVLLSYAGWIFTHLAP